MPTTIQTQGVPDELEATSTPYLYCAGDSSRTLPLTARSSKEWPPFESRSYVIGEVQDVRPAPSSEHSKVASERFDVNSNVASAESDGSDGLPVILVSSGWGSAIVQEWSAGVSSTTSPFEAATVNECFPPARPE